MYFGMADATDSAIGSLPDPTRPYIPPTGALERANTPANVSEPSLGLEFTFISSRQRLAVINGKRYHVGDKIAGYVVSSIAPDAVQLTKNGTTRTLNTTRSVITPRQDAPD